MITSIGDVMREAIKRGWITTRDGNVSVRMLDTFYITPSGVRKDKIEVETLVKGKFIMGNLNLENSKASGEIDMHHLLQNNYKGKAFSVVHLHPTYTLAAMAKDIDLTKLSCEFPELSRYTRVAKSLPVLPICSHELGRATYKALIQENGIDIQCDIVGQKNHGVTAVGHSPWDAFEHIERLEHICKIKVLSNT